MFLVAGLGNPGEEYALTPHNLGFLAVDRLAEQHGIRITRRDSKALVGMGEIDGREVMLAKPQTFMNLSGTSLGPLMEKHGIELGRLVIVYDELDLPWKALRIKPKGLYGPGPFRRQSVARDLRVSRASSRSGGCKSLRLGWGSVSAAETSSLCRLPECSGSPPVQRWSVRMRPPQPGPPRAAGSKEQGGLNGQCHLVLALASPVGQDSSPAAGVHAGLFVRGHRCFRCAERRGPAEHPPHPRS